MQDPRARQQAISAAIMTIGIPFGMGTLFMVLIDPRIFLNQPVQSLLNLGIVAGFIILQGTAIGWFAHWYFSNSSIRVERMAIVIAALFDVSIVGWTIVMMLSSFHH